MQVVQWELQKGFMGKSKISREDIIRQIAAMKKLYPSFKSKEKEGGVVFTGDLFIKSEFPIYNVSIEYRGDLSPRVTINSPDIVTNAPHRYKEGYLCLYHPQNYHWNKRKLVATDIIGWTAAWAYFYECWLQYGEWFGPEVPHNNDETKS